MRGRIRSVSTVVLVVLALGACSGGESASPSTTAADIPVPTGRITTIAEQAEAPATALLRLVNIYVLKDAPPTPIDVYYGFDAKGGKTLVTGLAFGAATDYLPIDLTGGRSPAFSAYREGKTDAANRVSFVNPDLGPRDVKTLTISASASLRGSWFSEATPPKELPPGKVLVVGSSVAMYAFVFRSAHFPLGAPGRGCLPALDNEDSVSEEPNYVVDPGTLQIAAFPQWPPDTTGPRPPLDCAGAPVAGPVTLDAPPDSRFIVFVYGTSPTDLRLLPLRLKDLAG